MRYFFINPKHCIALEKCVAVRVLQINIFYETRRATHLTDAMHDLR